MPSIINAKYGKNSTYIDVTQIVKHQLHKHKHFIICNKIFGDCARGVIKELKIQTNLGTVIFPEGDQITQEIIEQKIKQSSYNIKTGLIITTYGNNFVFCRQAIESAVLCIPNLYLVLFINGSNDERLLHFNTNYLPLTTTQKIVTIIHKQPLSGGLTETWNIGIDLCLKNNCQVVLISNDDVIITQSISYLIKTIFVNNQQPFYFGPVSNNPGLSAHVHIQYAQEPSNKDQPLKHTSQFLNGFFMGFSPYVLNLNKFDSKTYFNPKFHFCGNEVDWYNRFVEKGGSGVIVPQTFIYHYKLNLWNSSHKILLQTCVYTYDIYNGKYKSFGKHPDYDIIYITNNTDNIYQYIKHNIIPIILPTCLINNKRYNDYVVKCPHIFLPDQYKISVYINPNNPDAYNKMNEFLSEFSKSHNNLFLVLHKNTPYLIFRNHIPIIHFSDSWVNNKYSIAEIINKFHYECKTI